MLIGIAILLLVVNNTGLWDLEVATSTFYGGYTLQLYDWNTSKCTCRVHIFYSGTKGVFYVFRY